MRRRRARRGTWWPTVVAGVFVASTVTGCAWVERVSVDGVGIEGDADSCCSALSADGRYVAFLSLATNLVPDDTNGVADIFLRDAREGTTTRVSVDSDGNQADGESGFFPAISANGRFVAFDSVATNLVPGDTNGVADVFLRDTLAGTTTRVSVDGDGNQADAASVSPSISADGRYVAFESSASNLVPDVTNGIPDVFVRDTVLGTTTLVSISREAPGSPAAAAGGRTPAISADGRYVAFASSAPDLVPDDTNERQDVFVRDLVAERTVRVSVSDFGFQANQDSRSPAISAHGRYVTFVSQATNLTIGGDNGTIPDVYVRDTALGGRTIRVSQPIDGFFVAADDESRAPVISGDGRYVAFESRATNLVPGDASSRLHVYVRDLVAGTLERASVDSVGDEANGFVPSISADGRYVSFMSLASNLVPDDTNDAPDVFVRANPQPRVDAVTPTTLTRGTTAPITITGTGFLPDVLSLSSGGGLTYTDVRVFDNLITAEVTVAADAPVGSRDLVVILEGTGPGANTGAVGHCASCFDVS